MAKVKLVVGDHFSSDWIGAHWTNNGQIIDLNERNLQDATIKQGFKKGILEVVKEAPVASVVEKPKEKSKKEKKEEKKKESKLGSLMKRVTGGK